MNVRYGFLLMKIKKIRKSGNQKHLVELRHNFDLRLEESCPRITKFWSFTKNVLATGTIFVGAKVVKYHFLVRHNFITITLLE